ncbi:MAG: nitrilase-related carbon-nitrogen hydrolase [Synergistaceae bacterium]|nr:nitrilase-related carbon-nitrogen hydrolase [Synergistaceae bacterium]
MPLLRIGVIQTDVKLGDRAGNYARAEAMIDEAYRPSDIPTALLLPELWDVGYAIEQPDVYSDPDAKMAAEFLGRLAKKYKCWFVGGSVFAVTEHGPVNRAMAVSPSGEYVAHYDKAHLFPGMDEDKFLKPGNSRTHVEICGVNAGMALCYDIRFCEWTSLYAVDGTEALFVAAEWPIRRVEHWRLLIQARAVENMMYAAGCNRCGDGGGFTFGGHSMIVDPWGKILCECGDRPEAAFAVIDTSEVSKGRGLLRTFEMRRPEIYR